MIANSTVIHEKTLNMKHEETERRPRVTCDFALPNCGHAAVFDDMYLRCFPHCCPHHRERSYCGSSVHVLVHSTASSKSDQLVVYGRFRPMHADPLALGTRLTITSVEASLQSKDPSKGQWIESKACETPKGSAPGSQMYEINPEGRWYYPWSGAATIAMRLIEHIFEAHVFRHVGSELELVAVAGSTKFRLMSFRRGSAVGFKEEVEASPPRSSALKKRKAVRRHASPTDASVNQQPPTIESTPNNSSGSSPSAPSIFSTPRFPSELPSARLPSLTTQNLLRASPLSRPGFQDGQVPIRSLLNPTPDPSDTPSSSSSPRAHTIGNALSGLLQWLHEIPVSSVGSKFMLAWERVVDAALHDHISASQGAKQSDLASSLSALDVSAPASFSMDTDESSIKTVDSVVRFLLHLWLNSGSSQTSTLAIGSILSDCFPKDSAALASAYDSWLAEITSQAKRFLEFSNALPRMESESSTSRSDEFSYHSFLAKARQQFMLRHRQPRRDTQLRKRQRTVSSLCISSRVWTSRMEDVSIKMTGTSRPGLSLLTAVQFWKHLSCLRLDFSPRNNTMDAAQLSVASVFNSLVSSDCFTKLTLDGQYRWFNCLPSGESTVGTTLMGYVVGDYVGRATSAGTVHITTYLWPAVELTSTAMTTAYAWHWTMDGTSLLTGSSRCYSAMTVVVESASMRRTPYAIETMSMAEKLRCVGPWQHAWELQLSFNSIPQV